MRASPNGHAGDMAHGIVKFFKPEKGWGAMVVANQRACILVRKAVIGSPEFSASTLSIPHLIHRAESS
ncbi:Uncharacterised protein [Mycobacteroides abscessus subsp. abscessus]|nr:Uncharacterised protein [Mycobacteroides abscessus subsp. abscessus]